jgi:hypothetical protein
MTQIDTLFNRLDAWRHFPNYQLERRADIFFSLYLPQVLEDKLGFPIRKELIPEFPVHKVTINKDHKDHKTVKIDYIALSKNDESPIKALFVELKTDVGSLKTSQTDYLKAARDVGLKELLKGLFEIYQATNSKQKYRCLLNYLLRLELLQIKSEKNHLIFPSYFEGIKDLSEWIEITPRSIMTQIVYVIPNTDCLKNKPMSADIIIITFQDFAKIVRRNDDDVSSRFAYSLDEWVNCKAGSFFYTTDI